MFEQILDLPLSKRQENATQTVVVGMSGGVDSSVSAAILKAQGYKVIGLFMKNWEEQDEHGVCQASKEFADVVKVCEKLDIPYYSVEFVNEYRETVFRHFLEEYKQGHTPNPDVLCNREIKFKVFFEYAQKLGADFLATGHYCQKRLVDGQWCLVEGLDPNKGQAYFLYTIKSEILSKVLFPVGHLEKSTVRALAQHFQLATASKKDSTGICFIGERNFKKFLGQYLAFSNGPFQTLNGEVVGQHSGVAFYTIGQRKGLGLGGQGEAWFVVGKDPKENIVYVERGENHPALYADSLTANQVSWVMGHAPGDMAKGEWFSCQAKIRYRQTAVPCLVRYIPDSNQDKLEVKFPNAQRAITPRQSVVFYSGDLCLGGAMIIESGPTLYHRSSSLKSTSFLEETLLG